MNIKANLCESELRILEKVASDNSSSIILVSTRRVNTFIKHIDVSNLITYDKGIYILGQDSSAFGTGIIDVHSLVELYRLPLYINKINNYFFSNSDDIYSVFGFPSVTVFGKGAFMWCTNLIYVYKSQNLKIVEADAFRYCKSLTSLELPDDLFSFDISSVSNCPNLVDINIPKGAIQVCSNYHNLEFSNRVLEQIDKDLLIKIEEYKKKKEYENIVNQSEKYLELLGRNSGFVRNPSSSLFTRRRDKNS